MSIFESISLLFSRSRFGTSTFVFSVLFLISAVAYLLIKVRYDVDLIRLLDRPEYIGVIYGVILVFFSGYLAFLIKRPVYEHRRYGYASDEPEIIEAEKEIIKGKVSELVDIFHISRIRLLVESERLKFTSNKNLTIGIVFSVLALTLLGYFVLTYQQPSNANHDYIDFLSRWLVPRLSIVLLIQVVGFFFLRLYVANELDIKHNKNELTNLESRLMAYAMAKPDKKLIKFVVDELAKTERNFILKKGEKTLSHEHLSEFNDLVSIVEKLMGGAEKRGRKLSLSKTR